MFIILYILITIEETVKILIDLYLNLNIFNLIMYKIYKKNSIKLKYTSLVT